MNFLVFGWKCVQCEVCLEFLSPALARVLVEVSVGAGLEVSIEVVGRVSELGSGRGDGLRSKDSVPSGLGGGIEMGPRARLLDSEPGGLDADGVLLIVPRAVVLERDGEFKGVLLVLVRGGAREGPHGVEGNGSNGLEERKAAKGVDEVGQAVLSSAVDATLDLVGAPVAIAVAALQDKGADVKGHFVRLLV